MASSVSLLVEVSRRNHTETAKKLGFTYKTPDSRYTAFGGVLRDEDGAVVDDDAAESDISSVMQADLLPIDYVVITDLSELFEHAVSEHFFTVSVAICLRDCALLLNFLCV